MKKSTPVPVASTYEEAYPNSTKVYDEQIVQTPAGPTTLRVPFREVALGGGEKPVRLYDTSGPQGHDPRAGLPQLRESWVAPRRAASKAGQPVTQLHYARKGEITPEMAYIAFIVAAVCSAAYLWRRTRSAAWDRVANASVELGVVFTGLTLLTGMKWGRIPWGP